MSKSTKYIRLAEVPESALKSLYDQKWGQGIMEQLGEDFDVDAKSAQFLFHSVWSAVIGLMDRVLQKTWKVDTTQFAQDPTFMQSLAGLAYFVSDDAIKKAVGLKSDSLQKGAGHAEALMQVIGQSADVQQTLQGLAKQAEPIADKAFEQLTSWLGQQEPQQKAASLTNNASVLVAFLRQADDGWGEDDEEWAEQPRGYILRYTYGIVTPESAEDGDYAEHGFVQNGQNIPLDHDDMPADEDIDMLYGSLAELVNDLEYDHTWLEWSSSPASPGDWITSEEDEDYTTGEHTTYDAHITHEDGSDLTAREMQYIHDRLRLYGEVKQPQQSLPLAEATAKQAKLSDKQLKLRKRKSEDLSRRDHDGKQRPEPESETLDLELEDQVDLSRAYKKDATVERVAITPKYADRLVREWATKLDPGDVGHRSIWLYPVVRMNEPVEGWLDRAEHEGLYIPAGQRDQPGIREVLQQQMNDQLAQKLNQETEAGQVGEFVYIEQGGQWGLMYETQAIEDLLRSNVAPKPHAATTKEQSMRFKGQRYREATPEEIKKLACPPGGPLKDGKGPHRDRDSRAPGKCRKCDSPLEDGFCTDETCPHSDWDQSTNLEDIYDRRLPPEYPGRRDRDSRAPAMQLTQQLGKQPKGSGERKTDQPKADGKVKKFFEWLRQKSHEASVVADSPRSRWGRLAGIEPSGTTQRRACGCGGRDRDARRDRTELIADAVIRLDQLKQQANRKGDQEAAQRYTEQYRQMDEKLWGLVEDEVEYEELLASRLAVGPYEKMTPGEINRILRSAAISAVELPSKCVADMLGIAEFANQTVTFEKRDDQWFVDGQDSKGVIGDDLVGALQSYCEQQTTANTKEAKMQDNQKLYRHRGALYREASHFTQDNTEGYSDEELAGLNQEFAKRAEGEKDKSLLDSISEKVLMEYDTGKLKLGSTRTALEGEQTEMPPEVTDDPSKFRGFNLNVLPDLAAEALDEIKSNLDAFYDPYDDYAGYWVETLMRATNRPEDYADVLEIDKDDPEWQEALREGWDYEYIEGVEQEINDKIYQYMKSRQVPGSIQLTHHEADGSYGLEFTISGEDLEQMGLDLPKPVRRW